MSLLILPVFSHLSIKSTVFIWRGFRPTTMPTFTTTSTTSTLYFFYNCSVILFLCCRFYLDIIHYHYVRTVAPDQTAGGVLAGVTPCPLASVCIRTLIRAMPVSTRYYLTGRSLDPRSLTFSLYSHFPVSLDNKLRYILPSVSRQ